MGGGNRGDGRWGGNVLDVCIVLYCGMGWVIQSPRD